MSNEVPWFVDRTGGDITTSTDSELESKEQAAPLEFVFDCTPYLPSKYPLGRIQTPHFQHLANTYENLHQYLSWDEDDRVVLDWHNPKAVRELNLKIFSHLNIYKDFVKLIYIYLYLYIYIYILGTLLFEHFDLDVTIPLNRLCPPVTNRLSYLCWIQALLTQTTPSVSAASQEVPNTTAEANPNVCGIDIGTGASCIYPLLGHTIFNWNFVASECDDVSYTSAVQQVTPR